jgi:hypothetical protein
MAKSAKGKTKKSAKVRDMSPNKNPKGGLPAVQRGGNK